VIRRPSSFNTARIDHLYHDPHAPETRLFLYYGDMTDGTGLREILTKASRAKQYFGFQAQMSFDEGLRRTLEYWRKHPR
jgi:GDPmannose 4,6-dehydratase